jgi:hypothetical protein
VDGVQDGTDSTEGRRRLSPAAGPQAGHAGQADQPSGSTGDQSDQRQFVPSRRQALVWAGELLSVSGGLFEAYLPGSAGINARTREQLILSVTSVNGCRQSAWVHDAWLDFLGRRDVDEALAPLFDYARSCAEIGVPLDATVLEATYAPAIVRSVRATVARAQLANLVGLAFDDLVAGVASGAPDRRRWSPRDAVRGSTAVVVSAPFTAPSLVLAAAMKALSRLAPRLPEIDLPPPGDANLVVHLLAEAAPTYLGHTFVRASRVWSPVPVVVAFRLEGTAATIRIGRGRVAIANGVDDDALLVVEGGVEPLLQTVTGSILRDLGIPFGRNR